MKKISILSYAFPIMLSAALILLSTNLIFAQTNGKTQPTKPTDNQSKIAAESVIEGTDVFVKLAAVKDNAVSANEYAKPDAGNKFVSVQIVLENKSDGEWEVKPDKFKLKDAEGNVYETESSVSGLSEVTQPTLKSSIIDGGDLVKGWITFQVGSAVNAKSLKLRYEDAGILSESSVKSGWIILSAVLK